MSSLSVGRDRSESNVATAGLGSPCGACKFLRRKCAADCIFAPYFSSNQGPARFAAVHKVFGASNVSKLLMHLPVAGRCEAVVTITYEAQARIRDPVYGCVSHVFALQQQVAYLQAQLLHVRAQLLAQNVGGNSWDVAESGRCSLENSSLPKGSLDPIDRRNFGLDVITRGIHVPSIGGGGDGGEYSYKYQKNYRANPNDCDLGELHTLFL